MSENVFEGFKKYKDVDEVILEKYKNILPDEFLEIWKKYGFGTILNGYIKIVNPMDYQDILDASYFVASVSIPIMVTAFGDIITWEKNTFIKSVKYKNGTLKGIAASFRYFWGDLITSNRFKREIFEFDKYAEALKMKGPLEFDECYGYVPLLGLGGSEEVSNLSKVKIREHILLITELVGRIE